MRKFLALLVLAYCINPIQAQNNFSFNCTQNITIDCATKCINLNTTIPDIHATTNSYVVNQVNCFRGYVNPATPGPSANLNIDDRYSPVLNIGFPFSFYGITYNNLIASTNGFLSFDVSKALTFSHFGILNLGNNLSSTAGTPEDLPSTLYDKALIMGPYHDLDRNSSTTSQQIKYEVVGNAPYRKWILSYYNVPLYTTACLSLQPNTQQIVLYETLNIIEIFIYDKEVCLNWNDGRSMIGLQDFNKTSAIMAPGRQATSAPWGSQGMNESWRFTPSSGTSLFKKSELYTLSGALVAKATTSALGNNNIGVNFLNVCPPDAGETYLVKSIYASPTDPAADIISVDTINVSRGEPISVDISAGCAAGSKGNVTVTSPTGAYEYSIDGASWQSSNQFNLSIGSQYRIRSRAVGTTCTAFKDITVEGVPLSASVQTLVTPCPGPPTASITITPSHGTAPYLYSLDGGNSQPSNVFSNLTDGYHKFSVTDAGGCSYTQTIYISTVNSASATVTNTVCGAAGTGTITVFPNFGVAPYTYSINGGAPQNSNVFTGLEAGTYSILIKDASSCSFTFNERIIGQGTLSADIEMIMPKCSGMNNGSVILHPSKGTAPYKFSVNGFPFQTDSAFHNLLAGNILFAISDSMGCEKDTVINLLQPNPLKITAITTSASTCTSPDGQIFVKANGGTTPYQYSIDNGINFSLSNIFITKSGTYPILITDKNGCVTKGAATVASNANTLLVELGPDTTLCSGDSISIKPLLTYPDEIFNWSPSKGISDSLAASPNFSPVDTTKYFLNAILGDCQTQDNITINVLHKPIVSAGTDTVICYNTSAVLHGSATNLSGPVTYLWLPSADVQSPSSAVSVVTPKAIRPNIYRLQVTDNYGCNFKVYDKVTVTMNPPVAAFAGNDTVATLGAPHQLMGSGGIQYLWSPSNMLNDATVQNPVAILQSDTRFNLTVKDTLGCIGTASVLVKVYNGTTYYLPNAFTPNGDGINDIFKGVAPGIQKTYYFRIYNRAGQLMFESNDVNRGWDGKFLGVQQPTAVYVWILKGVDKFGKMIELKGTVTLIR